MGLLRVDPLFEEVRRDATLIESSACTSPPARVT